MHAVALLPFVALALSANASPVEQRGVCSRKALAKALGDYAPKTHAKFCKKLIKAQSKDAEITATITKTTTMPVITYVPVTSVVYSSTTTVTPTPTAYPTDSFRASAKYGLTKPKSHSSCSWAELTTACEKYIDKEVEVIGDGIETVWATATPTYVAQSTTVETALSVVTASAAAAVTGDIYLEYIDAATLKQQLNCGDSTDCTMGSALKQPTAFQWVPTGRDPINGFYSGDFITTASRGSATNSKCLGFHSSNLALGNCDYAGAFTYRHGAYINSGAIGTITYTDAPIDTTFEFASGTTTLRFTSTPITYPTV